MGNNGFMQGGITPNADANAIQYNHGYKYKHKKSVSPDKKMFEGFKL